MDQAGAAPGARTPCLLQGTGSSSVLTPTLQEIQGHCSTMAHPQQRATSDPPTSH